MTFLDDFEPRGISFSEIMPNFLQAPRIVSFQDLKKMLFEHSFFLQNDLIL